jgi:hypothetical protein
MLVKKSIPGVAKWGSWLLGVMILGSTLCASASSHFTSTGGDKKKDTARKDTPVILSFSNLKSASILQLTLKPGPQPVFFTGDFTAPQTGTRQIMPDHSLMTYQQGNTIFIYPYRPPVLIYKFKTPERILH